MKGDALDQAEISSVAGLRSGIAAFIWLGVIFPRTLWDLLRFRASSSIRREAHIYPNDLLDIIAMPTYYS